MSTSPDLRPLGKASYVVVGRGRKGAAATFLGPFTQQRAEAEREWWLAQRPQGRASVFVLARAEARAC